MTAATPAPRPPFGARIHFIRTLPPHVVREVSTFAIRNPRRGASSSRDRQGAR